MGDVKYYKADKLTLKEIKDSLPSWAIPTEKTFYIFLFLIGLIIVLNLFSFPFGAMMAGNAIIEANFGFPWTVFKTDIMDVQNTQIFFLPLLAELIICLVLAYIIEATWGIVFHELDVFSNQEKIPKLYKTK